jgi:DNA polymerase III subunit epsilon
MLGLTGEIVVEWIIVILLIVAVIYYLSSRARPTVSISHLPERFVVFDLETTGLDPTKHEIIEIGAIRVNRDSKNHDSYQTLIRPNKKVPKNITELTGINQAMLDADGAELETALREFMDFAGDLHLVSFNADFDMAFLCNASAKYSISISNSVSCALKMARHAWPDHRSYRLADLAKDGNLSSEGTHRALSDCQRALIVYTAAASKLGTIR